MGTVASHTRYASAERIGARVRAIRKQQKMTTTALAKKIGCSQQQICAVELGRINTPVEMLAHIAEALGVSLAALFAEDDTLPALTPVDLSQCRTKLHELVEAFEKMSA